MIALVKRFLLLLDMMLYPTIVCDMTKSHRRSAYMSSRPTKSNLKSLGYEVVEAFTAHLEPRRMSALSARLQRRYAEKMRSSKECMLPSFNHTLPTGQERGTYLALDLGGSTLRIALIELDGRSKGRAGSRVLHMSVCQINNAIRRLPGSSFFDWMADKIVCMLEECPFYSDGGSNHPLSVGLSWSFPVEQISPKRGKVQGMGKGFCCSEQTIGRDLGGLIVSACLDRGVHLQIDALVNDSCATLLSRAYSDPCTSMSLILGTGTNMAIHLPVSSLGSSKLEGRQEKWLSEAEQVTVNTELSMFGKGILPETRWDDILNRNHTLPNFQPLEYMTTGRYLGEILRLIIVEAVEKAGLFDGRLPSCLQEAYSLDTTILATIEEDTFNTGKSAAYLEKTWNMDIAPSATEMVFLRLAASSISRRAAAYIATAIHALWVVERKASGATEASRTTIACNGSVIERYPGFRRMCQDYIADIIECDTDECLRNSEIVLQMAGDAAILGAAVAVAMAKDQS